MQPAAPPLDVTPEELEALLEGVREALGEAGYQKLKAAIRTLSYVTELLENRETTLETLRRLLCQARTEKTEAVLEQAGIEGSPRKRKPAASKGPAVGHGRNGAEAYRGARRVEVPHPSRCTTGIGARSVSVARCTRCTIPDCWYGWKAKRPSKRRSMRWKSCAAICAGRRSRRWLRKAWVKRSTTSDTKTRHPDG